MKTSFFFVIHNTEPQHCSVSKLNKAMLFLSCFFFYREQTKPFRKKYAHNSAGLNSQGLRLQTIMV